ncbi:hypothetical protein V8F06_010084 [Rhypophila decipiens]
MAGQPIRRTALGHEPGSAKSVLSRALVDEHHVRVSSGTVEPVPHICYFFFKDDDSTQNSAEAALYALHHQLLLGIPSAMKHAIPIYEEKGEALVGSVPALWSLLETIINDPETGDVRFVLDALDECDEISRNGLIERIAAFVTGKIGRPCKAKFLLTSRPYPEIENSFRYNMENVEQINLRPGDDSYVTIYREINLATEQRVRRLFRGFKNPPCDAVQQSDIKELKAKRNTTYLWVSLVLNDLARTTSSREEDLLRFINQFPRNLDAAYVKLLNRILPQHQKEARDLFHVVLVAKIPLSLGEMDTALAIADGKLKPGGAPSDLKLKGDEELEEHIKAISGSLISIINGDIYLLHQTAREFLTARDNTALAYYDDRRLKAPHWEGSFDPKESHRLLSRICMTYLLVDELNKEAETTQREEDSDPLCVLRGRTPWNVRNAIEVWDLQFPFLRYSRRHWDWHYQHCRDESDTLVALGEQLCQVGHMIQFRFIYDDYRHGIFYNEWPIQLTPLEVALRAKAPLLVEAMVRRGAVTRPESLAEFTVAMMDIGSVNLANIMVTNMTPEDRHKSLEFACRGGTEQIVRNLIDTELFKPDSACLLAALDGIDTIGSWFKFEKRVSIIKLLLVGGADKTLLDEAEQALLQLVLAMDSRDLETASPIIMEWVNSNHSSAGHDKTTFEFIINFGDRDEIWGRTDRWFDIRCQIMSVFQSICDYHLEARRRMGIRRI